jgi:e3 binding domain
MAKQATKSRQSTSRRASTSSSGNGRRRAPTKRQRKNEANGRGRGGRAEKASKNLPAEGTVPEREYQDYTLLHPGSISDSDEPDVLLDVPVVNVDKVHFELDDLHARISLHAEVLDLVKLSVGVHAELGKVDLDIEGVEAQALLRVRLDHVTAILDRVLTTLDRNPDLIKSLGRTVEQLGAGAGHAVREVGEGAGSAVEDVGEGAEGAVKDVGKGAGSAVEDVGGGARAAVGEVGQGAGQAVGGLGQGAGQAVGELGGAAGALAGPGAGAGDGADGGGLTAPKVAKEAAKVIAHELTSAASDEARDLGLAARHKVLEIGERRRQRRAEKHDATEAALRKAEELGVDVDEVEGSGAGGRVTVRDVERAASE